MEFGSDFHKICYKEGKSILDFFPHYNLYALGRHALFEIVKNLNLKRLWVPSYYCRESLECLDILPVSIIFYPSSPEINPIFSAKNLPVKADDGLLIFNYFGRWGNLNTPEINCHIIEDHSHDLLCHWALNSNADWCFASLRKTIPISEGGILWSPSNFSLPSRPSDSHAHNGNAKRRQEAMEMKGSYLKGDSIEKDIFLTIYRETENFFDILDPSPLNQKDREFLASFDVSSWYHDKKLNWITIASSFASSSSPKIFGYDTFMQDSNSITPFSLVLLFKNLSCRNTFRADLISKEVYPAILWNLPFNTDKDAFDFSQRMLSVHCDGRYTIQDMNELGKIIQNV